MKSWRTTATGFLAIIIPILTIIYDLIRGEMPGADMLAVQMSSISAGLAGIFARDNKVTSEAAGAK